MTTIIFFEILAKLRPENTLIISSSIKSKFVVIGVEAKQQSFSHAVQQSQHGKMCAKIFEQFGDSRLSHKLKLIVCVSKKGY